MKQQEQLSCPASVPHPQLSGRASSCKRPNSHTMTSSSAVLRPPSKQKRSERETVGSKSPTSRAKRSCSETRKQSSSTSIACRRLFQDLPQKTTCTITSASCVTTTSAMGTLGNVVTPSIFYRKGLTVPPTHTFHSDPFKQPKREIIEYEQDILRAHSSTTTTHIGTTITTKKMTSAGHTSNEGDFLGTFPISYPIETGIQQDPPTSDGDKSSFINVEDSDYTLPFNLDQEPNIDEIEYSSHIKCDSPLLYSPERTAPVAPVSPVPVESPINIRAASKTVGQVTSFTIPDMRPPPVLSQKHSSIAECTGQATTQMKQLASASAAEEETLSKKSSPHSGSTRRSKIWEHFVTVGDGRTAACKLCGREVSRGRLLGHLTNAGMKQHMLTHHRPVVLREEMGVAPPSTTTITSSSVKVTATYAAAGHHTKMVKTSIQPTIEHFGGVHYRGMSKQQSRKITRLIGQLIAVGGASFNFVEGEPFKQLMQAVAPQYQVPSRTTFSRMVVPSLYRSCVGVLKDLLGKAAGQSVHFTTDLWSATSGQHAFLSLTAHWWQPNVSQDVQPTPKKTPRSRKTSSAVATATVHKTGLHSFLLHAEVMDQQHTSHNILNALQKMIGKWLGEQAGTNVKMGFVVSDGGANMTKAIRDGRFVGVRCCAHILHLVVRCALDDNTNSGRLAALLESCRKIAGHFHRSVKDSHLLRQEQRKAGLVEHCLKQDVGTRWNSTLHMLERILEQQRAIHAMSCEHFIGIARPLGREDWVMIDQVVTVLRPFEDVTDNLSKESASLAEVVPLFAHLSNKIDSFLSNRERWPGGKILAEVDALLRRLKEQLSWRIKELIDPRPEFMLATICDPRIKGKIALRKNTLTTWRDILIERVRERERQMGIQLEEGEEDELEMSDDTLLANTSSTAASAHSSRASVFWAEALDSFVGPTKQPPRKEKSAGDIVRAYLAEPPLPPSTDPLSFWDEKKGVWPALSSVAQELLSCPSTTVQSERVFSVTGNILCPQRSQLLPQLLEQMAFLKVNLPKLGYPALEFDAE
ncbi:zinc finger BED domain-containing protein 4-like [Aquarana catesbeiana]|uniref:zinc finger BED domain-containing protein 4-like n=2 Tax=Aquarana catesbeiana TaxID=8400 RepID=UPI003CCA40F3